jgi:hypothetical protein
MQGSLLRDAAWIAPGFSLPDGEGIARLSAGLIIIVLIDPDAELRRTLLAEISQIVMEASIEDREGSETPLMPWPPGRGTQNPRKAHRLNNFEGLTV